MKIHVPTPEDHNDKNIDYVFKVVRAYTSCFTGLHEAIAEIQGAINHIEGDKEMRGIIKKRLQAFIAKYEVPEKAGEMKSDIK